MGQINLGSGSYKDYAEWRQTPAGKQSLASHQAKYGDQSMSPFPRLWQPDKNWQQQLANYRQGQSGPPVIGNAPNGRPVTGAFTKAMPSPQSAPSAPDMTAYAPGRAQPQQPSQGTPYSPPSQPASAMPQFDYEGMMRQSQEQMQQYQDQVRQYYQQAMPQFTQQPAAQMSAPQVASYAQPSQQPAMPRAAPQPIPFTFTIPPAVTSPADLPPEQRPPGFTQTFTDPFGNQTQNNPMAQRDALIQRINEESLPYYMGRPGQFNPNLQELWGQAGNMVSNGWANPLAGLFG